MFIAMTLWHGCQRVIKYISLVTSIIYQKDAQIRTSCNSCTLNSATLIFVRGVAPAKRIVLLITF